MMTSLPTDRETRKRLGAWYTPPAIVKLLVNWAVRSPNTDVLDPAVGDGDFLLEAARRLRSLGQQVPEPLLFGVDVSSAAIDATADALSKAIGARARLVVANFFDLEPPRSLLSDLPAVDAAVGNPPYIRYQRFGGRTRLLAVRRAHEAGVRLSNLSSSWAAFAIHATSFLREGGRLALVLPEELVHSSYAAPVRRFLRDTFRCTTVIGFDGYLFPRTQERIVLLLAEGKGKIPAGKLRLARVSCPEHLDDLDHFLESTEIFEPSDHPEKWHVGSADASTRLLDQLVAAGKLVSLRSLGKAGIGYVSGANDYFVLKPSEARRRNFPQAVLRPTVVAARQVPGALFTEEDIGAMLERDERCLLWTGHGLDSGPVARYAEEGLERGIPQRYKCRVRDPWYVVPGVTIPHAFLTYMSHEFPRLVLNAAGFTCSNNLLAVRFDGLERAHIRALVAAFYNSATMLSAERIGRHYGGGVLKLEPSEAGRVLVPHLSVANLPSLSPLLGAVDNLVRSRKVAEALDLIDVLVLQQLIGLDATDVRLIRESRALRQQGRAAVRRARALREQVA